MNTTAATGTTTNKRSANQRERAADQRAAQVQALTAQLGEAVETLTSSEAWAGMLRVAARLHHYSPNNVLLLWAQACQRGMALSQVAGYRTWQELGRQVRRGEKALRVLAPIRRRLTDTEAAERAARGGTGYDADGRPLVAVRGFRAESVWDINQTDGQPLPDPAPELALSGAGPAGLWDALATLVIAHGYRLQRHPTTDGAHGWTNFTTRIVSVRPDVDEAEAVRILAHELGHIRAGHRDRDISRQQRETEADSIAYVVATACGLDLADSATGYVAGWSNGDPEILQAAAQNVHRAAASILADLDQLDEPATVSTPDSKASGGERP